MDNHKKLDSYNRFAKMKKEKIPASKTSPLAQTLILILKEINFMVILRSLNASKCLIYSSPFTSLLLKIRIRYINPMH
ncbi:hypothetical protein, partial [Vibrio parahaemolyticus]|uniref:hypothetical protein n=1 Tax=Vibrio parahaemolyticus TaxID=670 RepID=UPI000B31E927